MILKLNKSGTLKGGEIHYHFPDHDHIAWRIKAKVGPSSWLSKTFERAGVSYIGEARNSSFYNYQWQRLGDVDFRLAARTLATCVIEVKFAYGSAKVWCDVGENQMISKITEAHCNVSYGVLRSNFRAKG